MSQNKRNILLYLLIVFFPVLISTIIYANHLIKVDEKRRTEHAEWIASINGKSWDRFITETVTSLEIISITAVYALDQPITLEPLLQKVNWKDPRYSGLYLIDLDGKVIAGSNKLLKDANLKSTDFIQQVFITEDTIISNQQETFPNEQRVIGLATPVMNDKKEMESILVAYMRIDYIETVMKILIPNEKIFIINDENRIMLKFNISESPNPNDNKWYSMPIDRLPWTIKAKIDSFKVSYIIQDLVKFLLLVFLICHVLFILIKYVLLKKQAMEEKAQNEAQKLELVGTLAASTAHEIRNPLTGIKGLIQLLSEKDHSEKEQQYFSVINQEINRINQIVSEFLILGKPTVQKIETMDLREIFVDLKPLIESEANLTNIILQYHLPPIPIYVDCSKDQMKQVILNIVKNAFESMDNGGLLQIEVSSNLEHGKIIIKDSGIGISKENLSKLFDPFYTSKKNGTGLGLVVCKTIIQSFGGDIEIFSEENKGTIVNIDLPLKTNNTEP